LTYKKNQVTHLYRRFTIEQDPAKIQRLNRFRERILQRHTADEFNSEHEAAWKILAALRNYEIRLSEEQQGVGGIE